MKVDYEKFPDIPQGCQLNENKKTGLFQVFREHRVKDKETGRTRVVRETIGSIRDGVYRPGENYLLRQRIAELEKICAGKASGQPSGRTEAASETGRQAVEVQSCVATAVEKTGIDSRRKSRIQVSMPFIALAGLMCALGGESDAVRISDWIRTYRDFLERNLPEGMVEAVSHDTVRRCLMLVDTKKFEEFYEEMVYRLVRHTQNRVIAADGQAIRATGLRRRDDGMQHGARMVMSIYDTNSRVCLAYRLIDKKTNEITVGPQMIKRLSLSLAGSVVTADALSCQVNFVNAVLDADADYLISLKGNQELSWNEVRARFALTDESNMLRHSTDFELAHGRIEKRTVDILPGKNLSRPLITKWRGLAGGSIVRVRRDAVYKSTGQETRQDRFYVTSIPPYEENAERIYEAIRAHWGIENNLHYMLDVSWNQDAVFAKNPCYITNRSALNRMALAFLENYSFWLWDTERSEGKEPLSISAVQARCRKPEVAIECLAVGLGYVR